MQNEYHTGLAGFRAKGPAMLAVATAEIQALYDGQPLLTQVGGFPAPGSMDAADDVEVNEADDAAAG